ncbi:MAG: PilZ domain-containing protein, partial [Planctomycetota bacterium]|nr:PilZ domain-containing protein [Planctomycetota bacterium]
RGGYDLAIAAMEMPRPHGMDIIGDLCAQGSDLPVIFLSRFFDEKLDSHKKLTSLGPYEVLDKPIFINSLYERIEARLNMKIHWKERRREERVPIALDILFSIGATTKIRATTLDLSLGGVCIERKMCDLCTAYEEEGFHKECALAPESWESNKHVELKITLPSGETMEISGDIAHTLLQKENAREIIGVAFSGLEKTRLEKILRENKF